MKVRIWPDGEASCEHGVAVDVHCCNCHSGFIFERDHECPEPDPGAEEELDREQPAA